MMYRLIAEIMYLLCKNDVASLCFAMMQCLPYNVPQAHIISASAIIGEANIICRKANIIPKKYPKSYDLGIFLVAGEGLEPTTSGL